MIMSFGASPRKVIYIEVDTEVLYVDGLLAT